MRFEVDDNNCYVQCVYNCGKPRLLSMLFDTGAVCTTIRIDNIQGHPVMPTGRTSRFKTANETLILLQEITVQQFTVGNIDMGRCFVWTAPQVENLLGLDLLSKLNWEYSADTGLIEITKPVDGSGVTDAVSCVKEFCAKHNVPISVLTATFPDSWEKLTRDEIETLSLFTYNNILHRG